MTPAAASPAAKAASLISRLVLACTVAAEDRPLLPFNVNVFVGVRLPGRPPEVRELLR